MVVTEENLVKLLDGFKSSIYKIGVEGTIEALKNYEEYLDNSGVKDMEIVTNVVCDVYEVTRDELFFGRKRDGKRIAALEAAMHTMAYNYKIPKIAISSFFKKHISNVSRYSKEAFYYNPKNKADLKKIEKLNQVKAQLNLEIPAP